MGNQVDVEEEKEMVGRKGKEEFCAVACNEHKWPGGFVSTEQGKSFCTAI